MCVGSWFLVCFYATIFSSCDADSDFEFTSTGPPCFELRAVCIKRNSLTATMDTDAVICSLTSTFGKVFLFLNLQYLHYCTVILVDSTASGCPTSCRSQIACGIAHGLKFSIPSHINYNKVKTNMMSR